MLAAIAETTLRRAEVTLWRYFEAWAEEAGIFPPGLVSSFSDDLLPYAKPSENNRSRGLPRTDDG